MNIYLKKYAKRTDFESMARKEFNKSGISFYFMFDEADSFEESYTLSDISICPVCYVTGNAIDVRATFNTQFIEELLVSIAESNESED